MRYHVLFILTIVWPTAQSSSRLSGARLRPCGGKCASQPSMPTVFIFFSRMLIKANKEKIDVNIRVKNSKDNAYNTKVIVSFTPNINYVKVEVRFLVLLSLYHFSVNESRWWCMFLFCIISRRRIALWITQKWSVLLDIPSWQAM